MRKYNMFSFQKSQTYLRLSSYFAGSSFGREELRGSWNIIFVFFQSIRNPELVRGNQTVLQVQALAAKNFAVPGISYLFFSKH